MEQAENPYEAPTTTDLRPPEEDGEENIRRLATSYRQTIPLQYVQILAVVLPVAFIFLSDFFLSSLFRYASYNIFIYITLIDLEVWKLLVYIPMTARLRRIVVVPTLARYVWIPVVGQLAAIHVGHLTAQVLRADGYKVGRLGVERVDPSSRP